MSGLAVAPPRGVAVLDVGATTTRLLLFDGTLALRAEERVASARVDGPLYRALDPEPALALAAKALPDFDATLPVDAVVPCTHGAAMALLRADGRLAAPMPDYMAEPPQDVDEAYAALAPPFEEVLAPTHPACLTLGRQLLWLQRCDPAGFAAAAHAVPYAQALALWLGGGAPVSEATSMGCHSHLWDLRGGRPSSLARRMGWDRLLPPLAPAWRAVGALTARFRPRGFRGRGAVLAGVHDSSANHLRFAGAQTGRFVLLSTGTWIIGVDARADVARLDPASDTSCGLSIHGAPVPQCRFMGGEEYARLAQGAPARVADLQALIDRRVMAAPSFTDSGGPVPGSGGAGRVIGALEPGQRGALAALYCAQMTALALERLSPVDPAPRIVVDGPFAGNAAYLAALAALRSEQAVLATRLRDGAAAGAALLAFADASGRVPTHPVTVEPTPRPSLVGVQTYDAAWRALAPSPTV